MTWNVLYLPEAAKDVAELSRPQQIIVKKAITKVKENPLPQSEGGYGKPLGNKRGMNLANLLKIKLRGEGIRIVYKLIRSRDGESALVIFASAVNDASPRSL